MTPKKKTLVLFTGLAVPVVAGAALFFNRDSALDAWHALRTGWRFDWMPEGVVPGSGRALNEAGEVAAAVLEEDGIAGSWVPGSESVRPLGGLLECDHGSEAWAINERGSIAGMCGNLQGFFSSPETGMLAIPGDGAVRPAAINNHDQVVGWDSGGHWYRAFSWDREAGKRGLVDEDSFAFAINEQGWIVGSVMSRPALWKPGSPVRYLDPPAPGWFGGAVAVNERNQVLLGLTKWSANGKAQATACFLWSEERGCEALPVPEGHDDVRAVALNDRGDVLLTAAERGTGLRSAYVLSAGGLRRLPPARRGVATHYQHLNNRGWVAGYVDLVEGAEPDWRRRQGFLARPLRAGR